MSAERGYLRETGNLVFHTALVGVLLTVGVGGGFGYTGQRVVVEGQTFTNVLGSLRLVQPGPLLRRVAARPVHVATRQVLDHVRGRRTTTRSGSRSTTPPTVTDPGAGQDAREDRRSRSTSRCRSAARRSTCSATATRRRHGARRRGQRRASATGPVPAAGRQPHLARRHQGARRPADAARHDRVLLPDAADGGDGAARRRSTPTSLNPVLTPRTSTRATSASTPGCRRRSTRSTPTA